LARRGPVEAAMADLVPRQAGHRCGDLGDPRHQHL